MLFTLLAQCSVVLFTELTNFQRNMDIKAGGFHEKFGQNDIKALWLSETAQFFDKMCACELCVFKIMDIFRQIWDWSCDFFLKNQKKWYPIDFFGP